MDFTRLDIPIVLPYAIKFWVRKKHFNGSKKGLQNFVYQTKQSEFGHFGALVVLLLLSGILVYHQRSHLAMALLILNLLLNLYPVLLQRKHRARISALLP